MDALSPQAIDALGQWKLETTITVSLVCISALAMYFGSRLLERRIDATASKDREASKDARSREYREAMTTLSTSVDNLRIATDAQSATLKLMEGAVAESTGSTRVLLATLKGVINPADSRKIIESEVWALAKECARAYQVSLRENHYSGREDLIEIKLKRATARLFDRSYSKLKQFDMAVDPACYFSPVPNQEDLLRYRTVDELWLAAVPFYAAPANYTNEAEGRERDRAVYDTVVAIFRDVLMRAAAKSDAAYRSSVTDSGFYRPSSTESGAYRPAALPPTDGDSGLIGPG